MAVQTDSRAFLGTGCGIGRDQVARKWTGPIAAGENVPQGSIGGALLADVNDSPVIYAFVGDGSMRALGFANVGYDNTDGVEGAKEIDVLAEAGHIPDKNAGGGSAIVQTDIFKPAYGPDNGSVSKLAADGPCIGMLLGIDGVTGEPLVLIDPVVAAMFTKEASTGIDFTQTYATATATVPNPTATAVTDNSGGATADGTIGAVTAPTAVTDSSNGSASATLAAQTLPTAVTVGTLSGTADGALESIGATNGGDVSGAISNNFKELFTAQGSNLAQLTVLRNVTASFAARQAENRTAIIALTDAVKELSTVANAAAADALANRRLINKLIDTLQAAGLAG